MEYFELNLSGDQEHELALLLFRILQESGERTGWANVAEMHQQCLVLDGFWDISDEEQQLLQQLLSST